MAHRPTEHGVFPPMTGAEMARRGWEAVDVLLITGDAYVDHPSFGTAVISRVLEKAGYRVGVVAQPDWENPQDFAALGRPRLFAGITAGNMDSMVSNYTGNRLPRSEDAYAAGGEAGRRPNRATIVYAQRVRQAFGDVPIVLGGMEASLRRLAHYDYWEDAVRRSILVDAQADLIVYGMGERAVVEIARRLAAGEPVRALTDIPGTVYARPATQGAGPGKDNAVIVPAFEEVHNNTEKFNEAFRLWYREQDPHTARPVAQQHGRSWVVQTPPALPLTTGELDAVHALPFTRRWHPSYDAAGGVPALETVRWSITSHRGCLSRCAFCAIGAHQGHHISSRRATSIVAEARALAADPAFGGTITDVGGPTANMYGMACQRSRGERCRRADCLLPRPCRQLKVDHRRQLAMLRAVRRLPGVKHVFLGTGVRYDLLLADPAGDEVLRELCRHHVSGQLKVAPEHAVEHVLKLMRKPPLDRFLAFARLYRRINAELGKDQYLACYYVSAHPGATLADAVALAEVIRDHRLPAKQVQDFTPTPITLSAAMYYTGKNPLTGEGVYVARNMRDRHRQRALTQFRSRANRNAVIAALKAAGREDLIRAGPSGLLPSRGPSPRRNGAGKVPRRRPKPKPKTRRGKRIV